MYRRNSLLFGGAGLLALLAGTAPAAPAATPAPAEYTVQDLGPLPPVPDDIVPGLNDRGEIAAWSQGADGHIRAVVHRAEGVTDLGTLPADSDTFGTAINATGTVAGVAKEPGDARYSHAFAWQSGRMRDLGTLGGKYATARAVNDGGQIAGGAETTDGVTHAFLSQRPALRDLGALGRGHFSVAHALNRLGHVVGAAEVVPDGKVHGFLWRDGRMQDLGLFPGGSLSNARAINDRDEVVGWADLYGGEMHAFLWQGGRLRDLGTLGDEPSAAWGINDHGQVVGTSAVSAVAMHAFLWQGGRMQDLNARLPARSDWTLEAAYRINDRGQILGRGVLHGQRRLFLLTPSVTPGTHRE